MIVWDVMYLVIFEKKGMHYELWKSLKGSNLNFRICLKCIRNKLIINLFLTQTSGSCGGKSFDWNCKFRGSTKTLQELVAFEKLSFFSSEYPYVFCKDWFIFYNVARLGSIPKNAIIILRSEMLNINIWST